VDPSDDRAWLLWATVRDLDLKQFQLNLDARDISIYTVWDHTASDYRHHSTPKKFFLVWSSR